MESNGNRGIDQESAARENEDLKLTKELLDFTAARVPKLRWVREIYTADNTPAA